MARLCYGILPSLGMIAVVSVGCSKPACAG